MAELRTAGVEAAQRNAEQTRASQAREHVQVESAQYLIQAYEASRPARAATPESKGEGFHARDLARSARDLVAVPNRTDPPSYNIRAGADGVTGEEGLVRDALDRLAAEGPPTEPFLDLRPESEDQSLRERLQELRDRHHGSTVERAEVQEVSRRRRLTPSRA